MKMNFGIGAAVLSLAIAAAGMSQASTVQQLIHFDDVTNNGVKDYTTSDGNFFFDPTNFQSSSNCADSTNGGNGSCLIEGTQGSLPAMTRLTGDTRFSLDSFYFNLSGQGGKKAVNSISAMAGIFLNTYQLGNIYTNIYDYFTGDLVTTALVKGTGYIADVSALIGFDNVTTVQFSASRTAQVRLDCIVASFDGTTTEPLSGFTNSCEAGDGGGGTGPSPVPLPAGFALLLTGLGAVGLFGRRKARKA